MKDVSTSVSKTVRLKTPLAKRIENMAAEQNRNFSNMLETLLIDHFRNNETGSESRFQPMG